MSARVTWSWVLPMAAMLACTAGGRVESPGAGAGVRSPSSLEGLRDMTSEYVSFEPGPGRFALVANGVAAPLVVDERDHSGVQRAVRDLSADIARVSQTQPEVTLAEAKGAEEVVLIGTLGQSQVIERLVSAGKLDVSALRGRWETSITEIVEEPLPGISRALVITGSDPRGTIYGIYELSKRIGVSPWYYWDDVPAQKHAAVYVLPGRYSQGEPAVKYRGFFINDEDPALGTWAQNTFGPAPNPKHPRGFERKFYAKVYEVLLRLKGNYLWPAVWSRSLFDDDPQNHALATEYGVVMGTSHEAPMMRAQDEWNRYGQAGGPYGGTGEFSFVRNAEALKRYWADGIRRMNGFESIVTVGMRGNGDTGMEDAAGIDLMNSIVTTQRGILAEVTGRPPTATPQVWTLYKEVQQYWEDGMRAPDDVTINWCDDNWGNLRKLPNLSDPPRAGGYGIYYHFDYVGGGRNYKWNDTSPLPNVWEQLHLAYEYGVNRLWMVNVGDLKNNEHPLEFFMDYAWSPERWPIERLEDWEKQWAQQQFGPAQAADIGRLLTTYGSLQSRRKPELLNRIIRLDPALDITKDERAVVFEDGSPFSLIHYGEADRVVAEWQALGRESERIKAALPTEVHDAYYQLVHYPVMSTANLYELRLAQFKNLLYAGQGRASAALDMAALAERHFEADQAMSAYYNERLAGGKWKGFQTQPKLGYGGPYPNSSWQQPQQEHGGPMPDFIWPALVKPEVPVKAALGVAIDGSREAWPAAKTQAVLPELSPFQTRPAPYIEVFNRGQGQFAYAIKPAVPWLRVTPAAGTVAKQVRAEVTVDWEQAPKGDTRVPIDITGPGGSRVVVEAVVKNPGVRLQELAGFIESNGYVSMEAEHFDEKTEIHVKRGSSHGAASPTPSRKRDGLTWQLLPNIGRTGSGVTTFPVTAPRTTPGDDSVHLEYDVHLFSAGKITLWVYLSPRNNVLYTDGLQYAVSIDDAEPQIVNVTTALNGIPMNRSWERNTSDNVNLTSTTHEVASPGPHVVKLWRVDPTVIVQKLVLDTGGLQPSYLGPPESLRASRDSLVSPDPRVSPELKGAR